jgi:hypothetical protein
MHFRLMRGLRHLRGGSGSPHLSVIRVSYRRLSAFIGGQ